MIGRSGRVLSEMGMLGLFECYAGIVASLTEGEYKQIKQSELIEEDDRDKKRRDQSYLYLHKTYLKTGSLLAWSLRGVAIIQGQSIQQQRRCFQIGQHLGIAFQLIDDLLDYTSDTQMLGKQ